MGRRQPAGRVWIRQPWLEEPGHEAADGEVNVIRKEKAQSRRGGSRQQWRVFERKIYVRTLHEESDLRRDLPGQLVRYFYPRPPRGEGDSKCDGEIRILLLKM